MVKKAIIPAAGYGTRSLPITKVLPKEMFPICGRPAMDFVVEEAIQSGIEQILIVVSRSKNMILDYYDRSLELESHLNAAKKGHLIKQLKLPNVHIQYVRQTYARGLGDAILLGKHFVGTEPFAVLLPDEIILNGQTPFLQQLINFYKKNNGNVLGLAKMDDSELKRYGVIEPEIPGNDPIKIKNIIEKPAEVPPSNLAVVGRYILESEIFHYLQTQIPGAGGEIQLTDAIKEMISAKPCYGIELLGKRFDISRTSDYINLSNLVYKNNTQYE